MRQTVLHKTDKAILQEFAAGREAVLRTLAYFDIFNYPLTREEIQQFLVIRFPAGKLEELLLQMMADKSIFLQNGFYSLQENILLAHRRREGNQRAKKLLAQAQNIGRFLFQFPFVKAVGVSGSLSKNFADEKADIDFFIITKANRLWLARSIMHLYKKLTYLVGRQHYYCMNYYIDEEALELEERNIYTAIELKTLLPLTGEYAFRQLFKNNGWTNEWFPQCEFRQQDAKDPSPSVLKRFAEWMFSNKIGDWIDDQLQKITAKRWKRKTAKGKKNDSGHVMELITHKHYSYSNSGSFRENFPTRVILSSFSSAGLSSASSF